MSRDMIDTSTSPAQADARAAEHEARVQAPHALGAVDLLAADTALSLQVHPTLEGAREGYAREEAAGVPRDAAHRSYKDENHKPEMILALTHFEALCGFRPCAESAALFRAVPAAITAMGSDVPPLLHQAKGGNKP